MEQKEYRCPKCGKRLPNSATVCSDCGEYGVDAQQVHIPVTYVVEKNSDKGNVWKKVAIVLGIIIALSVIGNVFGNVSSNRDASSSTTSNAEAEKKAVLNVINQTKVDSKFAPTYGRMIVVVFHKYDITINKKSENNYEVIVKGDYCPNPDVPNLSYSGSMIFRVNTEKNTCKLVSDGSGIKNTMLAFIVNGYN